MQDICDDLTSEHDALDAIVADLDESGWRRATAAVGYTVADSVSHLWYFDGTATLAATDPAAFEASKDALLARSASGEDDPSIEPGRAISGAELLVRWREDRRRLVGALRALDASQRVPWYGPAMAARSFATARLMETWAHGQDVVDVLGATRPATARLRHIAHIGVRARPYAYAINGRTMPGDVRVELVGPDGDLWTWGDEAATDRIAGDALDFCLLVTQRRHRDDTLLRITGAGADEWASFAQAFAGPPGPGRKPGEY